MQIIYSLLMPPLVPGPLEWHSLPAAWAARRGRGMDSTATGPRDAGAP